MRKLFLLLLALSPLSGKAVDLAWIRISANLAYEGKDSTCKSLSNEGNTFYVAAELENGRAARIVFHNYPRVFPYIYIHKYLELSKAQVERVSFLKDSHGRYWLKSLPLSEELLKWVLYVPGEREILCRFPSPVARVTPNFVDYEFETDDLEEDILVSHSQRVTIQGTHIEGHAFKGSLKLIQREHKL